MKLLFLLVAALALIAAPVMSEDAGVTCSKKAPQVVAAIGQFCTRLGERNVAGKGRFSLALPRFTWSLTSAMIGYVQKHSTVFKDRRGSVAIRANCDPPQWIPKEYCFEQLYSLCATGDWGGANRKNFGRNGCQQWWTLSGKKL